MNIRIPSWNDWGAYDYGTVKYSIHRASGLFYGSADSIKEAKEAIGEVLFIGEEPIVYKISRDGKAEVSFKKLLDSKE